MLRETPQEKWRTRWCENVETLRLQSWCVGSLVQGIVGEIGYRVVVRASVIVTKGNIVTMYLSIHLAP
jgi:hypothetical protein